MSSKVIVIPFKELFAETVVGFGNYLLGFTMTFIAFADKRSPYSDTRVEGLAGSINLFTSVIGALLLSLISDKFGRKVALQGMFLFYAFGGGLLYVFDGVHAMYFSRVFIGIGTGGRTATILYTSEVCDKSRRGIYVTYFSCLISSGLLVSYFLQYFFPVRTLGGLTAVIGFASLIGMCFVPESKYWYIIKNRREQAKKSALWFDDSIDDVALEKQLNAIEINNKSNNCSGIIKLLRQRTDLKYFIVATLLFVFRTGVGREPLVTYPTNFFARLGTVYDPKKITLVQGILDLIVSISCSLVIDKFNRRTLVFSYLTLSISSLIVLLSVSIVGRQSNSYVSTLVLICTFIYSASITSFLFPLVSIIACEVVSRSNESRNTLYNLAWTVNSLIRAFYTAFFPEILNHCHLMVVFVEFLCSNLLLLVLIVYFIPETANKVLHECIPETGKDETTNKDTKP